MSYLTPCQMRTDRRQDATGSDACEDPLARGHATMSPTLRAEPLLQRFLRTLEVMALKTLPQIDSIRDSERRLFVEAVHA